jgi:hypothetical protein
MKTPPFHRRILPWVFVIIFLAAAPVVVFYTAGYRWNPKKEKIERNGTLIIDSTPTRAKIFLNGNNTSETTPVTLQNLTPGVYHIRIEKEGYRPWEKQLEIFPERVTFANDILLWINAAPEALSFEPVTRIEAAPNASALVMLEPHASSSRLIIWQPDTDSKRIYDIPRAIPNDVVISWSNDSRSVYMESTDGGWLIDTRSSSPALRVMPGVYRWNGNSLEGTSGSSMVSIRSQDGSVTRSVLPFGVVDRIGDIQIRSVTGTEDLVLFRNADQTRGLILPSGHWTIYNAEEQELILRDGDRWLSVDPSKFSPHISTVTGDRLRPFTKNSSITYLTRSNGEIWTWIPSDEPELISRESASVKQAAWLLNGKNIVVASERELYVLNIDSRDGRIRTPIATFDTIKDIAIIGNILYVSGAKYERDTIWKIALQ